MFTKLLNNNKLITKKTFIITYTTLVKAFVIMVICISSGQRFCNASVIDNNEEEMDIHNSHEDFLEDIRDDDTLTNNAISEKDLPKFGEVLQNVTVPVGREAILQCVVDNLQTYKIAWLRVDTQTILTIQNHVITKNHRMSITHVEKRAWVLKIRDIKESDKGWYMCQINTDPMKNQVGYLDVVVPPDILDYPTSTDMVIREGSNVTLKCAATGSPTPTITWRRENGEPISVLVGRHETQVISINSSILNITRVNRLNMGAYLCIASNGIPPSVSKRVMLIVHFPPMIWIQNQLVGAAIGQTITLECQSEAFPKSINYWMKNDTIIVPGERFIPDTYEKTYKVIMKLTIRDVNSDDFSTYKCVAKNSLGDTDGAIKLYHIPHTTTMPTTLEPTTSINTVAVLVIKNHKHKENINISYSNINNKNIQSPAHDLGSNNFIIGTTSNLWNTQDILRDINPDYNNYRSDIPKNSSSSVQHDWGEHLKKYNKKSTTSSSSSKTLKLILLYKYYQYLIGIHFILLLMPHFIFIT